MTNEEAWRLLTQASSPRDIYIFVGLKGHRELERVFKAQLDKANRSNKGMPIKPI